jgi:ferritin-like metal-binding protein YciE
MIDRKETLRDQIATIVQAGYSQRKTSVETADKIIKLSDCATTLEEARGVIDRQEALIEQLRKDKARLRAALERIVALGARMPEDAEEVCIAKAALSPAIHDSKL